MSLQNAVKSLAKFMWNIQDLFLEVNISTKLSTYTTIHTLDVVTDPKNHSFLIHELKLIIGPF